MSRYRYFSEEQRLRELTDALERSGFEYDADYGTSRAYAVGVFMNNTTYIVEVPTSANAVWYVTDEYNEMEEYPRNIDQIIDLLDRLS